MRGALCTDEIAYVIYGIIPAYAGSTVGGVTNDDTDKDHPRVCGEHPRLRVGLH